ncbi:MAG: N-acetyl-gamma-glutamyl-phosphate reductase [Saprospiraceae bacterium]|nr:N-acetyl-gamma-glutamyl-phosphate reductase [Saprospiraceae bacterium]
MINIGIIGGAGYTAGELLRILLNHPSVNIRFVHSNSNAGNLLSAVHTDLIGETYLTFTDEADYAAIDVLFLCVGHGDAKKFVEATELPKYLKIIDLSQDYRHGANPNADTEGWVYGLPELNKSKIEQAQFVANPGCFATAIQLAILPLAAKGLLKDDVHVNAITGSTGAGQKPTDTSHFSWRNNNISIYEAFKHRHLKEITASVKSLQADFQEDINFLPVRGNFTRGIYASVYTKTDLSEEELKQLYKDYYENAAFTHVVDQNPNLKQVVGTNKGIVYVSKYGNKVLIVSMIDNLLKGASGQAVQNMNLMCGLSETEGLKLKAVAF